MLHDLDETRRMLQNLLGQFWSVGILEILTRMLAHETERMLENFLGQLRGRREGGKKMENPSNRSGSPCKCLIG